MRVSSLIAAVIVAAVGMSTVPASAGPYFNSGARAEARQEIRQDRRAFRRDVRQNRRAVRQASPIVRYNRQVRRIERRVERRATVPFRPGVSLIAPRVRQANRFERRATRRDLRQDRRAFRREVRRAKRHGGWYRGDVLPRSRFVFVDHRNYGLRAPRRGYRYVRVGSDLLLVAIATGVIVDVLR